MTRLVLVLGLLALLLPAGAVGRRGATTGTARQTSIFYYPWYGNPQVDGSYIDVSFLFSSPNLRASGGPVAFFSPPIDDHPMMSWPLCFPGRIDPP